jgi:hypothetical protein
MAPTPRDSRSDSPFSNRLAEITRSIESRIPGAYLIVLKHPMIADAVRAPTMTTTRVVIAADLGVAIVEAAVTVGPTPLVLHQKTSTDTFLARTEEAQEVTVDVGDDDQASGESVDQRMMKQGTSWWVVDRARRRRSLMPRWKITGEVVMPLKMAKQVPQRPPRLQAKICSLRQTMAHRRWI